MKWHKCVLRWRAGVGLVSFYEGLKVLPMHVPMPLLCTREKKESLHWKPTICGPHAKGWVGGHGWVQMFLLKKATHSVMDILHKIYLWNILHTSCICELANILHTSCIRELAKKNSSLFSILKWQVHIVTTSSSLTCLHSKCRMLCR